MASTSTWVPPPAEISRNWLDLPDELTSSILVRLGAVDILMGARKVCKTWRQICSDPDMWRVVEIRHSDYEKSPQILEHVVKKAVDLSCGQMIQLHLEISGHTDNYVFDRSGLYGIPFRPASRSGQLRRLYLFSFSNITSEGLSEMLEILPLLEELHLDCICHFKTAVKIARHYCPQLKSLKLINKLYRRPKKGCDEDALAIAENMPGPDLESLDVSHSVANVGPDPVKRLSQQIKNLKLSYDSSEDSDEDDHCELIHYFYTDDEIDDLDSVDGDDSEYSVDADDSEYSD